MKVDSKHLLRRAVKLFIPRSVWNMARNRWNQVRYAWHWRQRKIVSFDRNCQQILFTIVNSDDHIQSVQAGGKFYEEDELINIARYFTSGGVFVDVGANTGQHAIFAAKFMEASKLIFFEPIAESYRILLENIRLNQLAEISDISHLGIGLSNRVGCATFNTPLSNLGGTSLVERHSGPIKIAIGDTLLSNERVDFIKIDTEGFEMKVLQGLVRTIQRERPAIFVEVADLNAEAFRSFVNLHNYQIVFSSKPYAPNENFIVTPK
jgi:FkbM family methyltransferase